MNALIKYDTACRAIAEAKRVDEVKSIRDVSIAMKAYARQAGNREMEQDAIEIRMRATRRMDQMRIEQKETIGLNKGGQPKNRDENRPSTLAEAGIDKHLAHEGRKLGALTEPEFERAVSTARDAIGKVVKAALQNEDKAEVRAERERELASKIMAMPNKQYGVILIDPPWKFEVWGPKTGMDRSADNHYPTMYFEELEELKIPAANDCALFMWATQPTLALAMQLIDLWGFHYATHAVWVKNKIGTGYWLRSKHEILLLGTYGNPPAPAPGTQWNSVIEAPVGAHSEKPNAVYEMIESYFPHLPKMELFARQSREGWDSWGNEVGQ